MEKSYYEILEVGKGASQEELSKAKRELSKKYHPDKLPEEKRAWGTKMIQQINEAYDVLSNPEKRQVYDMFGKDGLSGGMPQDDPFANFGANFANFGFDPSQFMGHNMGFNMGNHPQQRTEVKNETEIPVVITLEDIFMGKHIKDKIMRTAPCAGCDATGFEDKKHHKCDKCKGNGHCMERKKMGNMIVQQMGKCGQCNGTGNFSNSVKKCKKCDGKKVFQEEYVIDHKLSKGIMRGSNRIGLIEKEGNYNVVNSKRGDIIFVSKIKDHPVFDVKNTFNLEMGMDIELVEALCGGVKKFKFLDGKDVYIDINEHVNNGDVMILKGYGLPELYSTYKTGDLYIKFKVITPTNIPKDKLYMALTGNKYDNKKIHDVPSNITPVEYKKAYDDDSDDDDDGGIYESDSDDGTPHGPQNVQCAQQ
jgi:DnaJ family protein A protein 2